MNALNYHSYRNAIDGVKPAGGSKGNSIGGSAAKDASSSDSFNKHYNKELKVAEGKHR